MLRISMKKTAAAAAVTFAFVAGSLVQTSPIAPITSAHAQQAQLPDFTKLVAVSYTHLTLPTNREV